jgi:hypothetical protein
MINIHCPDCGAITRVEKDNEFVYLICTDDDCPRIIVSAISRPKNPYHLQRGDLDDYDDE